MGSTCIITDSSVQFTQMTFPGYHNIYLLNHQIEVSGKLYTDLHELKICSFPKEISKDFLPKLIPPSESEIRNLITSLLPNYDDLFLILLSKELSPTYEIAAKICSTLHGRAAIHCIDSQNVSVGLGFVVQTAAELATKGVPAERIEQHLRKLIPHIYTLLCTPNLSYLHWGGFIDYAQSVIGEMSGLLPIFTLEEGKLNPLEKVKNVKTAIDYFLEFIDEFEDLVQVSALQPAPPTITDLRMIHQHLEEIDGSTTYTEYPLSPYLASLIGPRGFGMVLMENVRL